MVEGHLRKMKVSLEEPVKYELRLDAVLVDLSPMVGSAVELKFTGKIQCVSCGRSIRKTYGDGFCFPCFKDGPESAECVIRPELCRAHLGEGRDVAWERENHLQPHVVYLAISSGLKVGVTRATQVPTRWIDQGAVQALVIARTENRHQAGLLEVALKQHVADRTDWRAMLRSHQPEAPDLLEARHRCKQWLSADLLGCLTDDELPVDIHFPVEQYPEKIKSLNLAKEPQVGGQLQGIKGQYLLLDGGRVLNIRKHSGYRVQLG